MGGTGSGNWHRWDTKDTVESYRCLDIGFLHKHYQAFVEGAVKSGSVYWRRSDGEPSGNISYISNGRVSLDLIYRSREGGGEWQDVRYTVPVEWTACRYGGERPWFRCPNNHCKRRVAKLYGGWYFLCRQCHNLAYASQQENDCFRHQRQADKLRKKLQAKFLEDGFIPPRPKGMHHRTYERLAGMIEYHDDRADEMLIGMMGRLLRH